jgi:hypothetical protein
MSAGLYRFIEDFLFEDEDLYWLVFIRGLSGVVMLQFREVSLRVVDTPLFVIVCLITDERSPLF